MSPFLTILSVVLFGVLAAACTSEAVTPTPVPSTQVAPATQPGSSLTGDPDLFREKAMAYWEAFNQYDLDAVLASHEPSYLLEREEGLRRDLGLLRQFGVSLGVEVHVPLVRNDRGEWEMLLLMTEPTGLRVIRMAWAESEGEWLLIDSTEVSE